MASGARASDNAGVVEFRAAESLGVVAGLATCLGCRVLLRLDYIVSRQKQSAGMATRTVTRRALENRAHMAGFTTCRQMFAG